MTTTPQTIKVAKEALAARELRTAALAWADGIGSEPIDHQDSEFRRLDAALKKAACGYAKTRAAR